jgi:hypothetical protein
MAASVLIAAGLSAWMWWSAGTRTGGGDRVAVHPPQISVSALVEVRPPTELELAIVQVTRDRGARRNDLSHRAAPVTNRPKPTSAVAAKGSQGRAVGLLDEGSQRSVREYLKDVVNPETRSAALSVLDEKRDWPVEVLIACLNDSHVDTRLAAARALGRINGPELTQRLANMARRDRNRREAMFALACSRGDEAKRFVRESAQSGPLVSVTRSILVQEQLQ